MSVYPGNKKALGILSVFVVLAGVFSFSYQYEKFEVIEVDGSQVERVYESCNCVGSSLYTMESYPPQYSCNGVELCRDVNYTRTG